MKYKFVFIFSIFSVFSTAVYSQVPQSARLAYETKNITVKQQLQNPVLPDATDKKKPALAGLLSLVLPGAGQYYNENYLAAGIFAAVEIGVIATAVAYNNKGDKQTEDFEAVANSKWSVVRYAEWIKTFKGKTIAINPDVSLKPWQRVDWDQLNGAEDSIAGFSHKLARYDEQQYYEMIGKYDQFTAGWEGFDPASGDNTNRPQIYLDYAKMRGKANDYYNYATKAVIGIYLNHAAAMVQAIWETISNNRNIQVSSDVKTRNSYGITDYQTNFRIKYFF